MLATMACPKPTTDGRSFQSPRMRSRTTTSGSGTYHPSSGTGSCSIAEESVETSAAEALRHMVALGAPALMLISPEFSSGNGIEFLKRLRAHPQLKDTAAIVCASKPDRRDFRRAIEAGADGFMMRTFDPAVLLAAVHTVLGA